MRPPNSAAMRRAAPESHRSNNPVKGGDIHAMLMNNTLVMTARPYGRPSHHIEVDVKKVGCSRNASRDTLTTKDHLAGIRSRGYQVHGAAGVCFRSRYLITNEDAIEVQGAQTSGEVEFVAVRQAGHIFISVGSDHNDRSLEELWTTMLGKVFDTAKSKQMAPAVVAKDAWLHEDVRDHWDKIVLRSFVTVSGRSIPYQEFTLAALLDLGFYLQNEPWFQQDGSVLLGGTGGTLPVVPEDIYKGQRSLRNVSFPCDFRFEMYDPVLKRTIAHSYKVISLEEPGSLSL